jgi:TolB-like protein/DNA-binding winged helix-turn-helix (wHTH) protein/Flp pilus assembly protein TadD
LAPLVLPLAFVEIVLSFSVAPPADAGNPGAKGLIGSFRVGACRVDPDLNRITGPAGQTLLEPKAIAVLAYLAERPGSVVSTRELVEAVWLGRPMGDNPVYRCISLLRRALGDNPRQPTYIATVATKGYRLLAAVERIDSKIPEETPADTATGQSAPASRPSKKWAWVLLAAPALALLFHIGFRSQSGDGAAESPAPTVPALAVLPFESVSASEDDVYLAAGIAEGVLIRLATLDQVRVIARTSSYSFKGSEFDVARIARLLGADYVLQGELQRAGDGLRVNVRLMDGQGLEVWSGAFDQAVGRERFAVQDEIATAVMTQFAPRAPSLAGVSTRSSFEAYQHYLIGHELLIRRPEGYAGSARDQFDRAIAIDPAFAEAYAERAVAAMFATQPLKADEFEASLDSAWRDIEKALELNPDTAQAHAATGLLVQLREPADMAAAEASLRHALALDPYLVNAWNWLSLVLKSQGRADESDEMLRFAAQLDPLAPTVGANLSRHEVRHGEFEAAEARLRRLMGVPQPAPLVAISLIELQLQRGRFQEALETARDLALRTGSGASAEGGLWHIAWTYAMLGSWERSGFWQGRALDAAGHFLPLPVYVADFGLHFSHPGYALSAQALEEAIKDGDLRLRELPDPLREQYGATLALAGDFELAIELLEPLGNVSQALRVLPGETDLNVRHALAWAWLNGGQPDRARSLLTAMQEVFRHSDDSGELEIGWGRLAYARNQLLLGERRRALDLFEQAERAGWRDYYHVERDPRWEVARGEPRYQAVMARVKSSIDTQRAHIEANSGEEAFIERLDSALRASQTTVANRPE